MANNIAKESLKANSELFLDYSYHLWEIDKEVDSLWSNYCGSLWMIEQLGFKWDRNEKGKHTVKVPRIH